MLSLRFKIVVVEFAVIEIRQRSAGARVTRRQKARCKMTIENMYRIGFCQTILCIIRCLLIVCEIRFCL